MKISSLAVQCTVFICGAVVMILEIVGSRILAPFLGNSLFVWTGLIGVVLGSLSIGYWLGGSLADKKPTVTQMGVIILGAAVAIASTSALRISIPSLLMTMPQVQYAAIIAAIILFGPASVLLGMVSPYAARISITEVRKSGLTVGRLYALSTLGSIFGTFIAGFGLIALLGTNHILLLLTIILLITGLSLCLKQRGTEIKSNKIPTLLVLALCTTSLGIIQDAQVAAAGIIEKDTAYSHFMIFRSMDSISGRTMVNLSNAGGETQSAAFIDNPYDLALSYTAYYRLAEHFDPGFTTAAMIGGGAFSFPKYFLKHYPEATIDVAEIDGGLQDISKQYFGLQPNKRLSIYTEDGRMFLNRTKKMYDVIYVDAFNDSLSIPNHLTTEEMVQELHDRLNPNGVVLLNIISSINGPRGQFLRAEYATYKKIFPQVLLFTTENARDNAGEQNIILVALKSDTVPDMKDADSDIQNMLNQYWKSPIATDMPILTDDFSPVDQYILPLSTHVQHS